MHYRPPDLALKIRSLVRRAVPVELRQLLAEARRRCRDTVDGTRFGARYAGSEWPVRVELGQPVLPGRLHEGKVVNLRLGALSIDGSLIEPGGQWSFWRRVGRPSAGRGFREGRTISAGRLVGEVGGGLCQLSGLVYHLALLGGLEIVERHPHSVDIYLEQDRYTPLGSDATVVWGYKDLRLRNPCPFPVSIGCTYDEPRIVARLLCEGHLTPLDVTFASDAISPGRVKVHTLIGGESLDVTCYEHKPELRRE
ncbi:MAG: VanW family protein [Blastocatellia bacterium]|nr:VanW family protein [Blastocatellia bacterium]